MARWRSWDDPDPWNILAKPLLWLMTEAAKRMEPEPSSSHPPRAELDPPFVGLRFCQNCRTGTIHREYWWPMEQETTYECEGCENVWVNG